MSPRLSHHAPRLSLALVVAALPLIHRTQGRRTIRDRWDVDSDSVRSLPLWDASDTTHTRLVFRFRTRPAYLATLRALAELWTGAGEDGATIPELVTVH